MGKRGPKKGHGGRPKKFRITDEVIRQVEAMAGLGLKLKEIALILGIGESTLRAGKASSEELYSAHKRGRAQGIMMATNTLREHIQAGNIACLLFFLKTQARWKEVHGLELTGEDGAPMGVIIVPSNDRDKPKN